MKFKTLNLIKAAVCVVFGFLLLVFPYELLKFLGAETGDAGLFVARLYGATLVGNLMLTWFAKDSEKSTARRAMILDLFVYDAIALVVTIYYILNGTLNWFGWGIAAVYLVFTLGYGYFWFAKKSDV